MSYFRKVRKALSIIRHKEDFVNNASYYPECELKSKSEILKDHLWFIWKYGDIEKFYFTYGFDRKEMTREKMSTEYLIPFSNFQRRIDYLNFQNYYL